jgi:acyl-CoA synthetase (AMP-forming)/AMP-acid ligase II
MNLSACELIWRRIPRPEDLASTTTAEDQPVNLAVLLEQAGVVHASRPAFVFAGTERTYATAAARARALGAVLLEAGVASGDRVALYMRNCPEVIEAMFATWRIGAVTVPLNATYTPEELDYHLRDCGARLVITDVVGEATVAEVAAVAEVAVLVAGDDRPDGLDARIAAATGRPAPLAEVDPEEVAWIGYTSGTTGRPKGAMNSHRGLLAQAMSTLADVQMLTSEHVTMHAAPLSHGSGYNAIAYTAKGCTQVIHQAWGFDPALFCEQVERYRVAAMFLVPTQIKMVVDHPEARRRDLTSLGWIMYGGAPMYREHQKRALEVLGPVLVQIFGQTESPMSGTVLPREEHAFADDDPRAHSVGRPRLGNEIAILDGDDNPLTSGATGEICIRGATLMLGYWQRPEETARSLRGGWLHTGDVGMLDEHGYLHILDRLKDMIISGGLNVYPHEIEDVLTAHQGIAEAAVIGIPDEKWGEAVHAVVVRGDALLDAATVIAHAKGRLAGYKCPKSVEFVDALPKTSYGKIAKRELRARYWAHLGRAV